MEQARLQQASDALHAHISRPVTVAVATHAQVVQHKYESQSVEDMSQFRQFLVSWLVELYPHMEPQPPFILNKISQLYAILVRHEYPENWDEAITTLLHALNIGQSLVDMFLRSEPP
jgi:hypothetical protein